MNFLYSILIGGLVAYYIARGSAHSKFGMVDRDERPVMFWIIVATLSFLAAVSIMLGMMRLSR